MYNIIMTKLWVKLVKNEKIVKSNVQELDFFIDSPDAFFESLIQVCHFFDVPTPVILSKHYNNYLVFNICTFVPSDFVESFPYDSLVIENATYSDAKPTSK